MRKFLFYPRFAAQNIVKNRRFFYPFMLAGAVMSAMLYDLLYIITESGMDNMRGAAVMKVILTLGSIVVSIFAIIVMLYSNGILMKTRKREFGLYNILGMQKRNIAHLIAWESLMSAFISILIGLIAGIALSKLAILLLFKLMYFVPPMSFGISVLGILLTAALFVIINIICFIYNILCVQVSKPIELLHSVNVGEREPKTKVLLTIVGVVTLLSGYAMALMVESPVAAVTLFFIAVILVIIGTYSLFTSGSIAILKSLKRNKSYYYKPSHFTAVSGMLYRMKQNAAGLASICILSTMVLVTISTTLCLYSGKEDSLDSQTPSDMYMATKISEDTDDSAVDKLISDKAEEFGLDITSNTKFLSFSPYVFGSWDSLQIGNYAENVNISAYITFITLDSYNALTGSSETLEPMQALVYWSDGDIGVKSLRVNNIEYSVKSQFDASSFSRFISSSLSDYACIVVPDSSNLFALYDSQGPERGYDSPNIFYEIFNERYIDFSGDNHTKVELYDSFLNDVSAIWGHGFSTSCKSQQREDFYVSFGGMFFIGLFLGALFLMATALIIYYKQISEGYDDKRRFEIMQKVGMSREEVKKSIRGQILTVFFLPLFAACVHLAFAFKMISMLLSLFQLNNIRLFFMCSAATTIVFAVGYAFIYAVTARTYYKIVKV